MNWRQEMGWKNEPTRVIQAQPVERSGYWVVATVPMRSGQGKAARCFPDPVLLSGRLNLPRSRISICNFKWMSGGSKCNPWSETGFRHSLFSWSTAHSYSWAWQSLPSELNHEHHWQEGGKRSTAPGLPGFPRLPVKFISTNRYLSIIKGDHVWTRLSGRLSSFLFVLVKLSIWFAMLPSAVFWILSFRLTRNELVANLQRKSLKKKKLL